MEQNLKLMRMLTRCGHVVVHRGCMNQSQNRILLLLYRHGPMSQKALMNHMHIQSGTLSEILNKVENAHFVEKKRSSEDKRNYEVYLTELGKKQAELFEKQQEIIAESFFQSLSQKRKDELEEILSDLLESWGERK